MLQVSRPQGRDGWRTEDPRKTWEMLLSWLSAFDNLQASRRTAMGFQTADVILLAGLRYSTFYFADLIINDSAQSEQV